MVTVKLVLVVLPTVMLPFFSLLGSSVKSTEDYCGRPKPYNSFDSFPPPPSSLEQNKNENMAFMIVTIS